MLDTARLLNPNTMRIEVKRLNDAYLMEAVNDTGNTVRIDSAVANGGNGEGVRPMQMLLMALAGCSAIDVIGILKKQRQELRDLNITVDGERESGKDVNLFKNIHVHFTFEGNVDEEKAGRAVSLSLDKYCSVAKTLEKSAVITHSFSVRKTEPTNS